MPPKNIVWENEFFPVVGECVCMLYNTYEYSIYFPCWAKASGCVGLNLCLYLEFITMDNERIWIVIQIK